MSDNIESKIIPAFPGWFVLEGCFDDCGEKIIEIVELPVIAWAISAKVSIYENQSHGYAYPITTAGLHEDAIIKSPDGSYGDSNGEYADKGRVVAVLESRNKFRKEMEARRNKKTEGDKNVS